MEIGRWSNSRTARICIDESNRFLNQLDFDRHQLTLVQRDKEAHDAIFVPSQNIETRPGPPAAKAISRGAWNARVVALKHAMNSRFAIKQ